MSYLISDPDHQIKVRDVKGLQLPNYSVLFSAVTF